MTEHPKNKYETRGDVTTIFLASQDAPCLIDTENLHKVGQYRWHENAHGYACYKSKTQHVLMHRLLCPSAGSLEVDHINGNRLDNRKDNLRPVTKSQQQMNRRKLRGEMVGISWVKPNNKWRAYIFLNGKQINLGSFADLQDAQQARRDAEERLFGQYNRPL